MKTIDLLRICKRGPGGCAGRTMRNNAEDPRREMALGRYRELSRRGELLRAAESARRDGLVEEMEDAARLEYGRIMHIAEKTGDIRLYARAFRIASGFGLGMEAVAAASEGMKRGRTEEEDILHEMGRAPGRLGGR